MNTNSYLPDAMVAPLYARVRKTPSVARSAARAHTLRLITRTGITAVRISPPTFVNYGDPELARWASSLQLDAAARQQRSKGWARLVRNIGARLTELVARRYAAWRRARDVRATVDALAQLDARTLKDIGLTQGELHSIAIDVVTGRSDRIRTSR